MYRIFKIIIKYSFEIIKFFNIWNKTFKFLTEFNAQLRNYSIPMPWTKYLMDLVVFDFNAENFNIIKHILDVK